MQILCPPVKSAHGSSKNVCVVSLVGFVMLCISYQPDEKTCVQFTVKLMYFLLSALALVACVLAVAFAAHHYLQMTKFTCNSILESCQCKLDTADPLGRTFVYQDAADCGSLTSTLNLYLLLQMVLNLIAALVCLLACFVMWKHRYQVFYVGVRFYPLTASEGQQQKSRCSITKVLSAKLQSEELQKTKVFETSFQMAFFIHLKITL
ncbi:hypothetical protein QYF61_002532 [Mycteria americana]|uniref:Sarcospan n=1 Tax=Mycteria americana TaxID=33587 RepID=A0AAN7SGR0_MYCAM|nr:hypothetical protein QYF61_002532 [Mycteria americana]